MSESNTPAATEPELDEEVGVTSDPFPVQDILREATAEKWIVWSKDGRSIVASGKDPGKVWEAARRAGLTRPLLEWVPSPYLQSPTATRLLYEPAEEVGLNFDQVPVEARLRFQHAEKWVAWAPDGQSIIASGDTHEEVREAAIKAGFPEALMEWVPPPYRQ